MNEKKLKALWKAVNAIRIDIEEESGEAHEGLCAVESAIEKLIEETGNNSKIAPIREYNARVRELLWKEYHLRIDEMPFSVRLEGYKNNESPEDLVRWFGEKYNSGRIKQKL